MSSADHGHIGTLVSRARSGDGEAFGALYTEYFTPLYRYVYFRVADKAEIDDLVQDIFVKAYASFARYVPAGDSPLPYFYTIARNHLTDYYRKKKTIAIDDEYLVQIPDPSHSPERVAAEDEERRFVSEAIAALPSEQQEAVILRYMNDVPNREIAVTLGKSEEAVRQLQSRGLAAVRARYRDFIN